MIGMKKRVSEAPDTCRCDEARRRMTDRYRQAWKNRLRVKNYVELARELLLRTKRVQHFGCALRSLSPSALVGTFTLVVLVRP